MFIYIHIYIYIRVTSGSLRAYTGFVDLPGGGGIGQERIFRESKNQSTVAFDRVKARDSGMCMFLQSGMVDTKNPIP